MKQRDIKNLPESVKNRLRNVATADKFEAMVSRDKSNSRVKDFYDIWMLSEVAEFDGALLQEAIRSTFEFYNTLIPVKEPICLTLVPVPK